MGRISCIILNLKDRFSDSRPKSFANLQELSQSVPGIARSTLHKVSSPVAVLKSELSREIFLLSPGKMLLGFLGFDPNTIREVSNDLVSFCPEKTHHITSDSAELRHDQHSF